MEFRDAARKLGEQVTTHDLADAFGLSKDTIRQARLVRGAPGWRSPPAEWKPVLARLARERATALLTLAEALER